MEGNFLFDIDEVIKNIDDAGVISVFFPTFRKSLIIDTRHSESTGPMVELTSMARSPQDRMRWIRRRRTQFPRPRSLTLIPWQRYIDSLVTSGVWEQILDRVRESGYAGAVKDCENALAELRKMEHRELVDAITGNNYHTLWAQDEGG